ncbi:MAG: hypothetical protein ABWY82_15130, partial [Tardiphaga sp.]
GLGCGSGADPPRTDPEPWASRRPRKYPAAVNARTATYAPARRKAEVAMQEKMQALTGGLGLPPGLGLT